MRNLISVAVSSLLVVAACTTGAGHRRRRFRRPSSHRRPRMGRPRSCLSGLRPTSHATRSAGPTMSSFRTLTFRIDSEAAEHVSVVSDTGVELETPWVPGVRARTAHGARRPRPGWPGCGTRRRGPAAHARNQPDAPRLSRVSDAANDDGDARGLLAGRAGATTKSFSGTCDRPGDRFGECRRRLLAVWRLGRGWGYELSVADRRDRLSSPGL